MSGLQLYLLEVVDPGRGLAPLDAFLVFLVEYSGYFTGSWARGVFGHLLVLRLVAGCPYLGSDVLNPHVEDVRISRPWVLAICLELLEDLTEPSINRGSG